MCEIWSILPSGRWILRGTWPPVLAVTSGCCTLTEDNYLIVSTLQLGFAMTLYVEGRPEKAMALLLQN